MSGWQPDPRYKQQPYAGNWAPPQEQPQYPAPPPPQYQPPRQPPGRKHTGRTIALWAAAAVASFIVVSVIASSGGGNPSASAPPAATPAPAQTATHTAKAAAKTAADPSTACYKRPPASGDIYVRMLSPGTGWEAQQLGGEWVWNVVAHKCLTSVQMMIAGAPTVAGSCTQVGYVKDNPGYDVNGTPAPPLRVVTAQAGPAC